MSIMALSSMRKDSRENLKGAGLDKAALNDIRKLQRSDGSVALSARSRRARSTCNRPEFNMLRSK